MRAPVPREQPAGTTSSWMLRVPAFLWPGAAGHSWPVTRHTRLCPGWGWAGGTECVSKAQMPARRALPAGLKALSSLLFQKTKQQSHTEEAVE